MKVVITTNKDGIRNGWDIVAETVEDEYTLGFIRNSVFFGLTELGTYPKYAGREDSKVRENHVTKLSWRIPKYKD